MDLLSTVKYWNYRHAILMLIAGVGVLFLQQLWPVLFIGSLSFLFFIGSHWALLRSYQPFGGYANWVTFARLSLVFAIGVMVNFIAPFYSFVLALTVICCDGLDGYLARRHQQSSDFGVYFDFETDTFLVCLLSCHFYLEGKLGAWILIIGFLRYVYVGLILLFGLQSRKEKSTRFAKTIAVFLFVAMLTPLVFPQVVYLPLVALVSVVVLLSFVRSFMGLIKKE